MASGEQLKRSNGIKLISLVIYIIVITILIFTTLEFALRALGFTHSTPQIMFDKYCYWRMAPNQKMRFKDAYGKSAIITINSLGARGKEFSVKKPSGEQRIICLGDSFTYCFGVDDTQTYPTYLQNLIDNDSRNIKVINFGCNGHTILQEVNFLKNYGLRLQPDYVILQTSYTDFNDIEELEYNIGYMPIPGYNFIKTCIRKTAIGNIMLTYWNSKKVKDIISHREQLQQMINKRSIGLLSKEKKKVKQNSPFEIYIDKLDELVKLGEENNFKIIYVIMPVHTNKLDEYIIESMFRDGKTMTEREYYEFLKNRYSDSIYVIELMSYFKSKDLFLPDWHLNARGNKFAAEIIYEGIQKVEKLRR